MGSAAGSGTGSPGIGTSGGGTGSGGMRETEGAVLGLIVIGGSVMGVCAGREAGGAIDGAEGPMLDSGTGSCAGGGCRASSASFACCVAAADAWCPSQIIRFVS